MKFAIFAIARTRVRGFLMIYILNELIYEYNMYTKYIRTCTHTQYLNIYNIFVKWD